MAPPLALLSCSLITVFVLGGCIDEYASRGSSAGPAAVDPAEGSSISVEECKSAFPDADPRFFERVEGMEDSVRVIHVERPSHGVWPFQERPKVALNVSAVFTISGSVSILLLDPNGKSMRSESFTGHKEAREHGWFATSDALAGDWTLRIKIERDPDANAQPQGAYTFGAYLREGR